MNAPETVNPVFGTLVIAQWGDDWRPAWLDERAGWVRIDTESRVEGVPGHFPRLSWRQPEPLMWRPIGFNCAARPNGSFQTPGGGDPQECDWPTCGCDDYANRVVASLEEAGLLKEPDIS
jgi:hypothetical protein